MSMITGTFRGGQVELDRPPTDWVEGSSVTVVNSDCGAVDIRGDSPSAIAAWMAWYDDLLAIPKSEEAAEEFHAVLAAQKREQKALSAKHEKRVDGLFS